MSTTVNFNYNDLDISVDEDRIPQEAEGLNGIPIRTSSSPVSYGDGTNVWAQNFDGRIVTIRGQLKGTDAAGYRLNMATVLQKLQPGVGRPLTVTLWDGTVRLLENAFVLQQPPTVETYGRINFNDFQVQFICTDPFYKSTTLNSGSVGLAQVEGFDFPFEFPFDFGRNGSNLVTLNNAGDKRATPTFSIDMGGGITNPYILNQTTGYYFQFNRSFADGDIVTVSYDGKQVTTLLNGSQNIFSDFVSNAPEYLFLESGDNTFSFSATAYDADALTTITWRDTYSYI